MRHDSNTAKPLSKLLSKFIQQFGELLFPVADKTQENQQCKNNRGHPYTICSPQMMMTAFWTCEQSGCLLDRVIDVRDFADIISTATTAQSR